MEKRKLKRILFFILLILLTPVLIIEAIIELIKKSIRRKRWKEKELEGQKLLLTSSITDIDIMEGYMFEDYLRILFFYMGYRVEQTQKSRDYGADLILYNDSKEKIVVQAKRYSKPVGSKSVQEIIGAISHYKANYGFVVTNNKFTPQAEQLAKDNGIRLIDRQELTEMYTSVCENLKLENHDGNLSYEKISLKEKYPYYI